MPATLSKPLAATVFTMFPPDIERVIIDVMDFPALMSFRALSRAAFTIVDRVLRAEFWTILRHKVPEPVLFEAAMRHLEAYAGSYAALAFLLRAHFHKQFTLELFLSRTAFDAMRRHMCDVQGATCIIYKPVTTLPAVLRWSVWRTPQGRITLYKSSSSHALVPIVHGTSSAIMVYVNPDRFGAVWPRLTFALRAMPGPLFDGPTYSCTMLREVGFTIRLYSWMWQDEGPAQECAASRFLCPAQPRYLHDAGAFRGSLHPGQTEPLSVQVCFCLDTRPCRGLAAGHIRICPVRLS